MHMLSVYLACFATGAMAVFFTGWLQNLHQREMLDTIARKNLLSMETKGYCSSEELEQMTEELTAAGFEDLDFSGTTVEQAGYGEEVCLNVRGTITFSLIKGDSRFLHRLERTIPVSFHLSTTAKH